MKAVLKTAIASVNRPILKHLLPRLSFRTHAYIAGVGYGRDFEHPVRYYAAKFLVSGNISLARRLLNARLLVLPELERRSLSQEVWKAGTTTAWAQRAFDRPEQRSNSYGYMATQDILQRLGRPIRVLELGCANGGSVHCLECLGVKLARFVGVDVSERMILEAQQRYRGEDRYRFVQVDFLEFCKNINEKFDVLLMKQTFRFLDQEYFENILGELSSGGAVERIVIQEIQAKTHTSDDSFVTDFGNIPVDYSHNYLALIRKHGFELESGGLVDDEERPLYFLVRMVVKQEKQKHED